MQLFRVSQRELPAFQLANIQSGQFSRIAPFDQPRRPVQVRQREPARQIASGREHVGLPHFQGLLEKNWPLRQMGQSDLPGFVRTIERNEIISVCVICRNETVHNWRDAGLSRHDGSQTEHFRVVRS